MISIITPALVKDKDGVAWLDECIASVASQPGEWEHIVVNDHSPAKLDGLKARWKHVRWLDAEGHGVSAARNQAAEAARGELLLPLDADDKLTADALTRFTQAWARRGDAGIVYSDCVMFGQDYAMVYLAPEYDFSLLLKATIMVVGALHRKEDWKRAGGWRLDMSVGLEDWEYWITLGELGVCGVRLPEPLYWYRRHPRGRLQWLKANQELWERQYVAMRELHRDSFNGRYPMGCCGGRAKSRTTPAIAAPTVAAAARAANVAFATDSSLVKLAYYGTRRGDFRVASGVTRTLYRIPGPGMLVEKSGTGKQGVLAADVPWFMSVNAGRDFRVIQEPKLAQPTPAYANRPAPAQAPKPAVVESKAWAPEVMEEKAAEDGGAAEPVGEEIKSAEEEPADTTKARRTRRR